MPTTRGIAEAVIAVVLAGRAASVLRATSRARTVALAATSFAIVGSLVGLSMTAQGRDVPDIVYHVTMLPVLVATLLVLLLRAGNTRQPD